MCFAKLFFRYHNSSAVVISALQVAKHPFITPGPSTVFTPPPTRHSTLPGVTQGILSGITMTGSLPHYYSGGGGPTMTPIMGLRNSCLPDGGASISSSGYPTPRPGSAASGFDNSFYMGSPQIGSHASNLFRSFPRPHSSPKLKLRLVYYPPMSEARKEVANIHFKNFSTICSEVCILLVKLMAYLDK